MAKPGDDELVRATRNGNREAFDRLMLRYQSRIYNLAYRITGNAEDAMDASQATFLKVHENLGRFDESRSFFSWIYRIGLNESLNIVNHRRRYSGEVPELAERRPSPEAATSGHETGRRIGEALASLKEDYRVVVVLRHIHGMSYREMSDATGVPVKTIKSRLFTARRELRGRLVDEGLLH